MLVKENTISPNHVAARPSGGSATEKVEANRKGKLRNGPPRRFLVIGAVMAVLAVFLVSGTGGMLLATRIPTMLTSLVIRTRSARASLAPSNRF
jgi:hypothetical protein